MAVTTIEGLGRVIRTLLKNNITDPLARGVTWIYLDAPRKKIDRLPMIVVRQIGANTEELGLGDQGRKMSVTYLIQVITNSGGRATIGSTEYAATSLRDYLTDKVIEVLIDNREDLKVDQSILDITIGSITPTPYDPVNDTYLKEIQVTFSYEKYKS